MFHMLAAQGSINSATDVALAGVADSEFSRQGNNFVFSEQYNLLAAYGRGLTLTDIRLNVPSINQYARHHINSYNRSATNPANPVVHDYRDQPIELPVYEQVIVEAANTAAGADQNDVFLWIAPPSFNRNIPKGAQRLTLQATGAVAGVAQAWAGPGALTFAENIKSGWYSIVGMIPVDAGTLAVRLIFSKPFMNAGRKMRPGALTLEALANFPWWPQMGGFGEWGRFHSQEPPQIEIYANATGASTQVINLDCVYIGSSPP